MKNSYSSERYLIMIKESLGNFGLDVATHIFGSTSDGAPVMKNWAKSRQMTIFYAIVMVCIWLYVL